MVGSGTGRFERYEAAGQATGRSLTVAGEAMVSSPNAWATLIGVEVLRAGGNAVDAALAVSAALMVAVPHQCSPGGDAFWLIRPPGGPTLALNASGRSASGASATELTARGQNAMPARGGASVTVPGVADGWKTAAARFATRCLAELFEPAIAAAAGGLPVTPYAARQLAAADALLASRPESSRVFRPAGRPVRVGERLCLPDLSETLAALAEDPRAMYEGGLAERIARTVHDEGGWLTVDDLAAHESVWTSPVSGRFRGWEVDEFPPNSQGWLTLVTLRLAQARMGHASGAARTRQLVEAAQAVYSLRDRVLADGAAMTHTPDWYLAPEQLAALADLVPRQAPAAARLGRTRGGRRSGLDGTAHGDTAAFAVIDAGGLAVSCIQSVYAAFGTGIVVPGTGVALQNRGSSFSLDPLHPNSLAPRKRPRHTLSPALATADGRTVAVFGSTGAEAQTQIHCQLLTAVLDDGMDPTTAVAAPRWFTRPRAGDLTRFEVLIEARHPHRRALAGAGHAVVTVEPFAEIMGHAQLILRDPETGVLCGAADPRSDGLALGF
jgi:gamma-glutamyltranspeptidase/glutathione hydrolase